MGGLERWIAKEVFKELYQGSGGREHPRSSKQPTLALQTEQGLMWALMHSSMSMTLLREATLQLCEVNMASLCFISFILKLQLLCCISCCRNQDSTKMVGCPPRLWACSVASQIKTHTRRSCHVKETLGAVDEESTGNHSQSCGCLSKGIWIFFYFRGKWICKREVSVLTPPRGGHSSHRCSPGHVCDTHYVLWYSGLSSFRDRDGSTKMKSRVAVGMALPAGSGLVLG